MNWKVFLIACVSSFLVSFPQNIIGCGGGVDAYDYYISFFNPDVNIKEDLSPFYFTQYAVLYSQDEPVNTTDILAEEWQQYCGAPVTTKDANAFVMQYALKDVTNLYAIAEKNKTVALPDSVTKNSLTNYFKNKKDLEALGYIMFAKKVEPYVNTTANYWEPIKIDSISMAKLLKNALQLQAAAKKEIFKLKYAYQAVRLAHYSRNYSEAIKLYDTYITSNKFESVLQPLSLALKAGALYHLGKNEEAVYLFSKAFNSSQAKKVSNFLSASWALNKNASKASYLALCQNNKERAGLLAMLAFNSVADESETIQTIHNLDPENTSISTLVAREINKLESYYFSNELTKQKGGASAFFGGYIDSYYTDSTANIQKNNIEKFANILNNLSKANTTNASLYATSAAYCKLMIKDYSKANEYLTQAKSLSPKGKIEQQYLLTKLLLSINESKNITAQTEADILPSLQWLQKKAITSSPKIQSEYYEYPNTWKIFYRNIMSIALAKKYHAQGDLHKEALCVGNAYDTYNKSSYESLDFLRNQLDAKDVEKLFTAIINNTKTPFEKYLIANNQLNKSNVAEFAGTAYLRSYDYKNAITWLQKYDRTQKDTINKSAFIELINDVEERLPTEKKSTSKLSFAKEMLAAETLATSDKANAAKHFYKLATGMYNITYYGHAWELVQYYRSGTDGYFIPEEATNFQKQYYGCYAAHDMYKKAMQSSSDKNFKGKCLFMMAKCIQKNIRRPQYFDFDNNWEKYEEASKAFLPKFKNNTYFPQLVKEYSGTAFYEEALSRCSYLSDFVYRKK
jgi:hypothetical protein